MRLLLIEDNARLAGLLAKLLTDNGYVVDCAATLGEAEAALAMARYDLLLLDLSLPDGDGATILQGLRQAGAGTLVLVATARGDLVNRVETLNAGADDYLVKPFAPDELLARVRALLRRRTETASDRLACGDVAFDTLTRTLTVAGQAIEIPRREQYVLEALLRRQGGVLRREALEQAVYPFEADVTPNAIEAAISRLRRRLDAAGASVGITALRGIGYLLAERPPC